MLFVGNLTCLILNNPPSAIFCFIIESCCYDINFILLFFFSVLRLWRLSCWGTYLGSCTYVNPCSSIFLTPFQKLKYRSLGEQSPDGNCATGNLNPQSLKKTNWSTWVANWVSDLPERTRIVTYCQYIDWIQYITETNFLVKNNSIPARLDIKSWPSPRSTKPTSLCFPPLTVISRFSYVKNSV